MRIVGTGSGWSCWYRARSSHYSSVLPQQTIVPEAAGTNTAVPGKGTRDRADSVTLEWLPVCPAVSVLEFCIVFYTSCFS